MSKTAQPTSRAASASAGGVGAGSGVRTRKKPDRAETLRGAQVAHDRVFLHLSNRQLAEKYGLSERTIRRVRSREEVRSLEQQWTEEMFDAHRAMGQAALEATYDLIQQRDSHTVNSYWKRMGITKQPATTVQIEELKMEVPPEIQKILDRVLRDEGEQKAPE